MTAEQHAAASRILLNMGHEVDIVDRRAMYEYANAAAVIRDDCDAHRVDWRSRCLAAEQRAEAAEAERDRMRTALDACVDRLIRLSAYSDDDSEPWERAVAAARAGQPGPNVADEVKP